MMMRKLCEQFIQIHKTSTGHHGGGGYGHGGGGQHHGGGGFEHGGLLSGIKLFASFNSHILNRTWRRRASWRWWIRKISKTTQLKVPKKFKFYVNQSFF